MGLLVDGFWVKVTIDVKNPPIWAGEGSAIRASFEDNWRSVEGLIWT